MSDEQMRILLEMKDILTDLREQLRKLKPPAITAMREREAKLRELTVEQVAQIIAVNMLLPNPPDSKLFPGYDMEGITRDLNTALAEPSAQGGQG